MQYTYLDWATATILVKENIAKSQILWEPDFVQWKKTLNE